MKMETHGTADRLVGSSNSNAKKALGSSKNADQTVGAPINSPNPHLGWYKRNLPHCDYPGTLQMISYHLADSLPAQAIERMETELQSLPPEKRSTQFRKKCEAWLDAGHGSCVLRKPSIAKLIIENWKHYEGSRYRLIAYVVMPNHVHVLIHAHEGYALGKIVQAWKGYTGRMIAKQLSGSADRLVGSSNSNADQTVGAPAQIWHREYWDRFIRNEQHYQSAIAYIRNNPVTAKLVAQSSDWPYATFLHQNILKTKESAHENTPFM
ncbi:MAG: transposase [Spartobacteria bacterium]|nr:transposase [Spartobacteria bacterium]